MSGWFEVAARTWPWRESAAERPPYVARVAGAMEQIDEWKKTGMVVTMTQTSYCGDHIMIERLKAWPKAASVEEELRAIESVGKRLLRDALVVVSCPGQRRGVALVLKENTLDARIMYIASARENIALLDDLKAIEDYGMWPRAEVIRGSRSYSVRTVVFEKSTLGGLEWPHGLQTSTSVHSQLRSSVMMALRRRYR